MEKIKELFAKFIRDEEGASATEYAVLIVLIIVVALAAIITTPASAFRSGSLGRRARWRARRPAHPDTEEGRPAVGWRTPSHDARPGASLPERCDRVPCRCESKRFLKWTPGRSASPAARRASDTRRRSGLRGAIDTLLPARWMDRILLGAFT